MTRYDPLSSYLTRCGEDELELDFGDLERIVGSALPPSASRPQWWANANSDDGSPTQSRAWRNAGYDAFLLPRNRVLFRRRAA